MAAKMMKAKPKYKRRTYRKRAGPPVYRAIRQVLSKRAEKKHFSITSTQNPDWSGTILDLSNISQGSTDLTRDGDSATIRTLHIKGHLGNNDTYNIVRLIVFQWTSNSNVDAPTVGKLLDSTLLGTVYATHAPYNHDRRSQFRVLWDKTFTAYADKPVVLFDTKYLRAVTPRIQYIAAGTEGFNKLYMCMISDSSAVSHPPVVLSSKLNFADM